MKKTITVLLSLALLSSLTLVAFTGTALGSVSAISVGNGPYDVAVNPNTNMIYVTNQEDDTVSVVDGTSNTVVEVVPVGDDPVAVDVNPETNTIYTANRADDTVSVINGAENLVVATVDVNSVPASICVNQNNNKIYVCCPHMSSGIPDGTISVIEGSSNAVTKTITGSKYPTGIDINPLTNKGYISSGRTSEVHLLDCSNDVVTGSISVGSTPMGISVNPNDNKIYVANADDDTVSVINGIDDTVAATVSGIDGPFDICINMDANRIYSSNFNWHSGSTVSVINGSDNTVIDAIKVGNGPMGIDVNQSTGTVYVANYDDDTVSVITGTEMPLFEEIPATDTDTPPEITGITPETGLVHSEVTITGSGFGASQGSSYVSFGSVKSGYYSEWTEAQIKCLVPEITGAVPVTVTVSDIPSNAVEYNVRYPAGSGWGFSFSEGSKYMSFNFDKNASEIGSFLFIDFTNIFAPVFITSSGEYGCSYDQNNQTFIYSGMGYMNGLPVTLVDFQFQDLGTSFFLINNVDTFNLRVRQNIISTLYETTGVVTFGELVVQK